MHAPSRLRQRAGGTATLNPAEIGAPAQSYSRSCFVERERQRAIVARTDGVFPCAAAVAACVTNACLHDAMCNSGPGSAAVGEWTAELRAASWSSCLIIIIVSSWPSLRPSRTSNRIKNSSASAYLGTTSRFPANRSCAPLPQKSDKRRSCTRS